MTEEHTRPRPILRDDAGLDHPETKRTLTWITRVDQARMWAEFGALVDGYQRTHAMGGSPGIATRVPQDRP